MSTALSLPTLPSSVTGPSHIPDLTELADIQAALKYLYYGSTGAANTANGIYGALTGLKNYVDASISGVNVHETMKMATTAPLATHLSGGTITTTYANGTTDASGGLGIGATLTIATSTNWTAITIDGQSLVVGNRILVKDQSTSLQNGIYVVSQVGAVGNTTSFIFTRAEDSNNSIAGEMGEGDFTFISAGTTNGNTSWILTSASPTGTGPTGAIRIGTDPVTFIQFGSISYGSQTANTFFAAPNASSGTPTFRGIDYRDIYSSSNPTVYGQVIQYAPVGNGLAWSSTVPLLSGGGTMTGTLNLAAGSTSIVPLDFNTTGALLTTPAIGSMEVDANSLYYTDNPGSTSTGPGRGVLLSQQMVFSLASSGTSATTTPVNIFAAANDVLSVLEPAKLYRFRAKYLSTVAYGGTAVTAAINFAFSNAPTAIKYTFKTFPATAAGSTNFAGQSAVTTATPISASIASSTSYFTEIDGYFTTNATLTSTFTPQFAATAGTGGSTLLMAAGSWIEIEKLGTSTQTLIAGNWA